MDKPIQFFNPEELSRNPAFSQAVVTRGGGQTIYIGGQNAVNAKNELIGKNDLEAQTGQVMKNIGIALKACGADFSHIVKWSIYIVQGQNLLTAFQASQKFVGHLKDRAAVTGMFVSALANPDYLIEIEAIAFLPDH